MQYNIHSSDNNILSHESLTDFAWSTFSLLLIIYSATPAKFRGVCPRSSMEQRYKGIYAEKGRAQLAFLPSSGFRCFFAGKLGRKGLRVTRDKLPERVKINGHENFSRQVHRVYTHIYIYIYHWIAQWDFSHERKRKSCHRSDRSLSRNPISATIRFVGGSIVDSVETDDVTVASFNP